MAGLPSAYCVCYKIRPESMGACYGLFWIWHDQIKNLTTDLTENETSVKIRATVVKN